MPPSPQDVKQITLQPGQFSWCRDDKTGNLRLYVGPTRLSPTEDDIFLAQDPDNPGNLIPVQLAAAVQNFVMIKPGEYAVVHNPASDASDPNMPNGKFTTDKNVLIDLDYGKTRVLTSGYFPVWPGQRVEIRPVHELQSNEYLIARVIDENAVDKKAPFYQLTMDCANIMTAVVDTADASPTQPNAAEESSKGTTDGAGETAEGEQTSAGDDPGKAGASQPPKNPPKGTTPAKTDDPKRKEEPLRTGQQIVIPGSKTPIYIPPTGVEVLPDTSIDDSGRPITPNVARELLSKYERTTQTGSSQQRGGPSYAAASMDRKALAGLVQQKIRNRGLTMRSFAQGLPTSIGDPLWEKFQQAKGSSYGDSEAIAYAFNALTEQSLMKAAEVAGVFEEPEINLQDRTIGGTSVDDLKSLAEGPRLVRQAVVLGPTEFCVLLDVDGRPQIHKGPGRVFPGPYDRFQTRGSRNRVYDAYHLRSDRGLLLRIIVERISKDALLKELPLNTPSNQLEKTEFLKGDEIFISGFDAYLVPSNSFVVIDPNLRSESTNPVAHSPHIGNDHSTVYVQAIGVDQKSGIYVMNVETGQVKLERGEKKVLLDPRKFRHVKRRVPGRAWNLMIGRAEPHKMVLDSQLVETPWALSVIIPNNEAVLITSKEGRRVVKGPCTELLAYEEWLEKLTLSSGRPKSEAKKVETCFLRVTGNRVSDRIELETSDFVTIVVDVAYGVTFQGEKQEDRFQWFDHRNYVRLLYTHLRSRLRAAARAKSLMELQPVVPDFIRDVVLGPKGDDKHRPGLKLPNGMLIDEVEVLEIDIPDDQVSRKMQEAQRTSVIRRIDDTTRQAELESNKLRDKIAAEQAELDKADALRGKEVDLARQEADHEVGKDRVEKEHELAETRAKNEQAVRDFENEAELKRELTEADQDRKIKEADEQLDSEIEKSRNELKIALEKELNALHESLIKTGADAAEKQLKAIQPELIAAIEGLGDKQVLSALANNLPEAGGTIGFLLGKGGIEAVKAIVKGTALEKIIDGLDPSKKSPAAEPAAPAPSGSGSGTGE